MNYAVGKFPPPPHIIFYKVFTQSVKEDFERVCRYQVSVSSTVHVFMLSVLQFGIHEKFCYSKQPDDPVLMLNTLLFACEFNM